MAKVIFLFQMNDTSVKKLHKEYILEVLSILVIVEISDLQIFIKETGLTEKV